MCQTKNELLEYAIWAIGIIPLLCIVLLKFDDIPIGEMEGYWLWIGLASISLSISLLLMTFFKLRELPTNNFNTLFNWVLIILGFIESIWGLLQLAGYAIPNHPLFILTGTFYNPGPFSGYLAVAYSVCLNELLQLKENNTRNMHYYIVEVILLFLLGVLIATMSRAAWVAIIISSTWICYVRYAWQRKITNYFRKNKTTGLFTVILSLFILFLFLYAIGFMFKKHSAYGRLFIWELCCQAIAEKPLWGHGNGSFAKICGLLQEQYFANGDYEPWQEYVAGIPEYAFNDYLQVAVEKGLLVLIIFLVSICFCWYRAYKRKKNGLCAGLMSFSIFAFFSYPLQIPVLQVTLYIIMGMCIIEDILSNRLRHIFIALFIGIIGCYIFFNNSYWAYRTWGEHNKWYYQEKYEIVHEKYDKLYPFLNNNNNFLYEYGHTLYELGYYEKSISILKESLSRSNSPTIWNLIGMNYWKLNQYANAEKCFIHSTNILPIRIYPYYLLAKLYSEPAYHKPEKMKHMGEIVLSKKPKVFSKTIKDMREEIKILLNEK